MILDKFLEKGIFFICEQIIKSDTAADEYFLDAIQFAEFSQKRNIIRMIRLHILTGSGEETLASSACTLGQLLFACGRTEIGGWTTNIMDVAFKARVSSRIVLANSAPSSLVAAKETM